MVGSRPDSNTESTLPPLHAFWLHQTGRAGAEAGSSRSPGEGGKPGLAGCVQSGSSASAVTEQCGHSLAHSTPPPSAPVDRRAGPPASAVCGSRVAAGRRHHHQRRSASAGSRLHQAHIVARRAQVGGGQAGEGHQRCMASEALASRDPVAVRPRHHQGHRVGLAPASWEPAARVSESGAHVGA